MHRLVRVWTVAAIATVTIAISGCQSSSTSSSAAPSTAAAVPSPAGGISSVGPAAGAGASAGSSPIAASSGAVVDPCVLVTAADVSAAIGATVPPSTSDFTGTFQICSYSATVDSAGDATVVIVLSRLIDKVGFDASTKGGTGEISPLAGVCQDAYVSGSKVFGWKNGTEVDASVDGMPAGGDPVAAVTKLVTGACARL
jgi:hypothetical protein